MAGVGRKAQHNMRPHIPADVWMILALADLQLAFPVLTGVLTEMGAAIECRSVPPGEAAHFVSAAPIIAALHKRA
jgi:hypothetical protein